METRELIKDNLSRVFEHIQRACQKINRDPSEITLVAVTKNFPPDTIRLAFENGIKIIGENKVQETEFKKFAVEDIPLEWHLIGHLQTNKVKRAVQLYDCIQSVDSVKLAERLNRVALENEKILDILIELNTSGESHKYGVIPSEALTVANEVKKYHQLRLLGFMTVGPLTSDERRVRMAFSIIREIYGQLPTVGIEPKYLSMGMSSDFEAAIEEGANMIRLGTALFGPRQ
jgi:PLP dependent protein